MTYDIQNYQTKIYYFKVLTYFDSRLVKEDLNFCSHNALFNERTENISPLYPPCYDYTLNIKLSDKDQSI